MKPVLASLALIVVTALLSACGEGNTEATVATDQIQANIVVYSTSDNDTHVNVWLRDVRRVADPNWQDDSVYLGVSTELWLINEEFNGVDEVLGDDWFGNLPELVSYFRTRLDRGGFPYSGALKDQPDSAGYTVSFLRKSGTEAPDSHVVLPRKFELLAPAANETLSRSSDAILIEWLPIEAGVSVRVAVDVACTGQNNYRYITERETDTGQVLLQPGEIDDNGLHGRCTTTLVITKEREGHLDPAYAGGSIYGQQIRTVSFHTTE